MEILRQAPQSNTFVSLADHQSTTPASFNDGPPILYYSSDRCKVLVLEHELSTAPAIGELFSNVTKESGSDETNGDASQLEIDDVELWVTSEKLFLYSSTQSKGLTIPYPTISLHAIQSTPSAEQNQSQGVYMQLIPTMPADEEELPDTVSITIIPTVAPATEDAQTPVQALFTALSECSNLHPDPEEDGDEQASRLLQAGLAIPGTSDGSLPPPMPGSGGWITAENMHEFIDENGNFIEDNDEEMESELGEGAGTVRKAPDDEDGDTKWQRTS